MRTSCGWPPTGAAAGKLCSTLSLSGDNGGGGGGGGSSAYGDGVWPCRVTEKDFASNSHFAKSSPACWAIASDGHDRSLFISVITLLVCNCSASNSHSCSFPSVFSAFGTLIFSGFVLSANSRPRRFVLAAEVSFAGFFGIFETSMLTR